MSNKSVLPPYGGRTGRCYSHSTVAGGVEVMS